MKRAASRPRTSPRARTLRVESLENRNLLSGLGLDWLALAGQAFCGPLRPSTILPGVQLPGATTATSTLLTDESGTLWAYNASQGSAATPQQIGSTGVFMRDLAFDGSSAYYGVDNASPNHGSSSALYGIGFSVNPPGNVNVVQKSVLHSTTGQVVNLNSLAYADGALWAAGSAGSLGTSHYLFKIDLTTFDIAGQWSLATGSGQSAVSYEPAGDIEFNGTTGYVTTTEGPLLTFNTSSPGTFQAQTILNQSGQEITDFQGLAFGHFSSTNLLLAFRTETNDVYRLDFNTNQWVQYGSLGTTFTQSLQGATGLVGNVTSVAPPAAEVAVVGIGEFGISLEGLPGLKQTFLVRNKGNEPLTTGPITLPDGYEITEGLDSVIPPHGCDTFTVRLLTDTPGTFKGNLLIPTNDGDGGDGIENPVVIPLRGTVVGLHRSYFLPWKSALPKVSVIQKQIESAHDRLTNLWAAVDAIYARGIF